MTNSVDRPQRSLKAENKGEKRPLSILLGVATTLPTQRLATFECSRARMCVSVCVYRLCQNYFRVDFFYSSTRFSHVTAVIQEQRFQPNKNCDEVMLEQRLQPKKIDPKN